MATANVTLDWVRDEQLPADDPRKVGEPGWAHLMVYGDGKSWKKESHFAVDLEALCAALKGFALRVYKTATPEARGARFGGGAEFGGWWDKFKGAVTTIAKTAVESKVLEQYGLNATAKDAVERLIAKYRGGDPNAAKEIKAVADQAKAGDPKSAAILDVLRAEEVAQVQAALPVIVKQGTATPATAAAMGAEPGETRHLVESVITGARCWMNDAEFGKAAKRKKAKAKKQTPAQRQAAQRQTAQRGKRAGQQPGQQPARRSPTQGQLSTSARNNSPAGQFPATLRPGVRGYAQPGYGPQGYAQPGYMQPGYAQPGYAPGGYYPEAYYPDNEPGSYEEEGLSPEELALVYGTPDGGLYPTDEDYADDQTIVGDEGTEDDLSNDPDVPLDDDRGRETLSNQGSGVVGGMSNVGSPDMSGEDDLSNVGSPDVTGADDDEGEGDAAPSEHDDDDVFEAVQADDALNPGVLDNRAAPIVDPLSNRRDPEFGDDAELGALHMTAQELAVYKKLPPAEQARVKAMNQTQASAYLATKGQAAQRGKDSAARARTLKLQQELKGRKLAQIQDAKKRSQHAKVQLRFEQEQDKYEEQLANLEDQLRDRDVADDRRQALEAQAANFKARIREIRAQADADLEEALAQQPGGTPPAPGGPPALPAPQEDEDDDEIVERTAEHETSVVDPLD